MITAQHCPKIWKWHYRIHFLWRVVCSWLWSQYGWRNHTHTQQTGHSN